MTGTYAGQFVMEGFIQLKLSPWKRVFITRCAAIVPAIIVAIAAQESLDTLDEWLNVLQSVQLPFALVPGTTAIDSRLTVVSLDFYHGREDNGEIQESYGNISPLFSYHRACSCGERLPPCLLYKYDAAKNKNLS